jgi:HEAT repeat protein
MRNPPNSRRVGPGWAVAVLVALGWSAAAPAQVDDPVEDLRQALPITAEAVRSPNALQQRKDQISGIINRLRTLGQLRQALAMTEWKDDHVVPELRRIDQALRAEVGSRFVKGVRAASASNDPTTVRALADMLGEMGSSVRSLDPDDHSGFTRTLAPELVKLASNQALDDLSRAAAARALGKINPDPAVAVPALKALLQQGRSVELRRAAAEGLGTLVRVTGQLQKKGRTQTGVETSREDVIEVARRALPAVAPGVADADKRVRRLSVDAIQQGAAAYAGLIHQPFKSDQLPSKDRKPSEPEARVVGDLVTQVLQEQPLVDALTHQGGRLARSLEDPDPGVRLLTRRTLEEMGNVRMRLKRRGETLPLLIDAAKASGLKQDQVQKLEAQSTSLEQQDPLGTALTPAVLVLARDLNDSNVRLRLAAIDFLEMLERKAEPALPVLVKRTNDPDRFVRWSAARTLGRMAPAQPKLVVPAMARLLSDTDLDVRTTAAATLEYYGSQAKAAVPSINEAITRGDAESRVAAMKVLAAIGSKNSVQAIQPLASVLTHPDQRVRKAAAEALGRYGRAAREAVPALRNQLGDDDAEVRRAVSDALLSILGPRE